MSILSSYEGILFPSCSLKNRNCSVINSTKGNVEIFHLLFNGPRCDYDAVDNDGRTAHV